ncbi:hypothetical protein CAC42_5637 [Sphaceloma murrayae]|uniref:DNA mismatch repair proteins mutS family domain-containing protein n=1 Tax=Sphaceloma murrayae TaxID=2082308 RepID=A0A2K1QYT2_9PEZI|nr:hypothetical protein CAC42_5637 [Sphaceloma murrayae]
MRALLRILPETCRSILNPSVYDFVPIGLWNSSVHVGHCRPGIQRRGAKKTTRVKARDLPQGALATAPLNDAEEAVVPSYPTVIQQHINNVRKFSDCVVLTRVGNFYELYAEQADKYGPILGLKVAKRKTALGPVSMSGFQHYQLDKYLKQLVQDVNKSVAISEEQRNSAADQVKSGGLMYTRKVNRVITAGTLIDESFVDPSENNYLLSVDFGSDIDIPDGENDFAEPEISSIDDARPIGLSWVDLSSGDFFTQITDAKALSSVMARVMPREVILPSNLNDMHADRIKSILGEGSYSLSFHQKDGKFEGMHAWNELLDRPIDISKATFSRAEVSAASQLLHYVQSKLQDLKVTLRPPVQRTDDDCMRIDKHSLRGLEIRSTLRDGVAKGSLLHAIRRTVTSSGARALSRRLLSPSMSIPVIEQRLDLVDELIDQADLKDIITAMLQRTSDTPRLLQKFSIGRGDADDLLSVGRTIDVMGDLFRRLEDHVSIGQGASRLRSVMEEMQSIEFSKLSRLSKRIQCSIDEEGLSKQQLAEMDAEETMSEFAEEVIEKDGTGKRLRKPSARMAKEVETRDDIWIMRRDASPTLVKVHSELDDMFITKADLTTRLRQKLNTNSLLLKWTAQSKYFCWVKGKDRNLAIQGAHTIGSTKSTRSFVLPEWSALGARIDEIRLRIRGEEARVFATLRDEVITNLVKLRRCSSVLDDLDIACSSASLAQERNLVRPILHTSTTQHIIGGRHPMVDLGLHISGRTFTPNDCVLTDKERIHLITGPNMGGKSTYLRQNALICIMAQTGLFVPATHANIGLVDQIFSRVGAADNLFNHQSTFMVEMVEVADILNNATTRSFVVMDEVGRGTTPEDGVAVGFACLKYLHDRVGCRTLFATHFHALADMTRGMAVGTWCTDVQESPEGWNYVHRLREGVNRESHALKVAGLAGMPGEAIETAREVLEGAKDGDKGCGVTGE